MKAEDKKTVFEDIDENEKSVFEDLDDQEESEFADPDDDDDEFVDLDDDDEEFADLDDQEEGESIFDKAYALEEEDMVIDRMDRSAPRFTFYSPYYDISDLMPMVIKKQQNQADIEPMKGLEIEPVIVNEAYKVDNTEFFKYSPFEVMEKLKDKVVQENCKV